MSQALTQYQALYASYRSRRVRPHVWKGADKLAALAGMSFRYSRTRLPALWDHVGLIEVQAPELRHFSEAALDNEIELTRDVFARRRQDMAAVRRGLALVREVARRASGEEAYPVQLLGALAMYSGRVVQMLTGEGKTLTGSLAATLIAWRDKRLHVLTVNDYLAARDAESRKPIYSRCRLDVGAITQDLDPSERSGVYARHIVYGTPKQITADWLRDQLGLGRSASPWAARSAMVGRLQEGAGGGSSGPMIPGLHAAIVDEADAVLIDEGVVPLIIARSRTEDQMSKVYREACQLAQRLDEGPDFVIDHVRRKAEIKRRGEERLRDLFADLLTKGGEAIWRANRRGEELIRQALVARHVYLRGQQYQIVEGKVVIIDEYTGRYLADRSWEHGLHQAVEAKESVEITADRETLARMSFQRFFRSYPFLCGMTGTAADATSEIETVYDRPVAEIPTNRPVIRRQLPTRVFRAQREKWVAVAASIAEIHAAGRPVLVGTRSITASELVSDLLTNRRLPHQVLNANFDKDEANIIASAGVGGGPDGPAITVATNMAGRGTDIKLDTKARAAGGLHVILTEMHGAQRIDRQFIGRAGRQGDPGSAQIFLSLEDELVQRFASTMTAFLQRRPGGGGLELTDPSLALRVFRFAQRRSEARDRRNRAAVLKQDDWIEKNLPGA
jgi:preprotein translocase subunit SecA